MQQVGQSARELQKLRVGSIQEGKRILEMIAEETADTVFKMREEGIANTDWNLLADKHHELIKAKRHIQNQMAQIFRVTRGV